MGPRETGQRSFTGMHGSRNHRYHALPFQNDPGDGDDIPITLAKNTMIGAGGGIQSSTTAIQATDQYSSVFLYVEEFIED